MVGGGWLNAPLIKKGLRAATIFLLITVVITPFSLHINALSDDIHISVTGEAYNSFGGILPRNTGVSCDVVIRTYIGNSVYTVSLTLTNTPHVVQVWDPGQNKYIDFITNWSISFSSDSMYFEKYAIYIGAYEYQYHFKWNYDPDGVTMIFFVLSNKTTEIWGLKLRISSYYATKQNTIVYAECYSMPDVTLATEFSILGVWTAFYSNYDLSVAVDGGNLTSIYNTWYNITESIYNISLIKTVYDGSDIDVFTVSPYVYYTVSGDRVDLWIIFDIILADWGWKFDYFDVKVGEGHYVNVLSYNWYQEGGKYYINIEFETDIALPPSPNPPPAEGVPAEWRVEIDCNNMPINIAGTVGGTQGESVTWFIIKNTNHTIWELKNNITSILTIYSWSVKNATEDNPTGLPVHGGQIPISDNVWSTKVNGAPAFIYKAQLPNQVGNYTFIYAVKVSLNNNTINYYVCQVYNIVIQSGTVEPPNPIVGALWGFFSWLGEQVGNALKAAFMALWNLMPEELRNLFSTIWNIMTGIINVVYALGTWFATTFLPFVQLFVVMIPLMVVAISIHDPFKVIGFFKFIIEMIKAVIGIIRNLLPF